MENRKKEYGMWDENPCGMLIRQRHLSLARRSDHELREHNLTLAQLTALLLLTETPEGEQCCRELRGRMAAFEASLLSGNGL